MIRFAKSLFVWVAAPFLCVFSIPALSAPINVLIIGNDPDMAELTNGLSAYPDFGTITAIPWSAPPTNAAFVGYDAILVTERFDAGVYSNAWGDLIADFARVGGGVTCGFAFYSTLLTQAYGKLQHSTNNPFTRGPRLDEGSLGQVLIPGHPMMEGVTNLTTSYRYDVATNTNTVVVAVFEDGLPLAGYLDVGDGRVTGIQASYRLDPFFSNSGGYMQLYRNAIVCSVARPRMLAVVTEGGGVRVWWRGAAGERYTLQATTNLSMPNSFTNIAPQIKLDGSGFMVTNHLDAGTFTNWPHRFYRVQE